MDLSDSVQDLQQKERPWHKGDIGNTPTHEGNHGQEQVYRIGG